MPPLKKAVYPHLLRHHLRRICSKLVSTCAVFNCCSATPVCAPPASTSTWHPALTATESPGRPGLTCGPGDPPSRPQSADVVRQHGDVFLQRYGHTLSGAARALRDRAVSRPLWADISPSATTVGTKCRRITRAATGAAPNAMARPKPRGSRPGRRGAQHAIRPWDLYPAARPGAWRCRTRVCSMGSFRTVAQTLQDIAGDPKHLGAEIGGFAVLHTWGQQPTITPISIVSCRREAGPRRDPVDAVSTTLLPARPCPLARFRRLYLAGLAHLYGQGHLTFAGRCQDLAEPMPWQRLLADVRDQEWVVFAKSPSRTPRPHLPGPLHPSGGHLQPPTRGLGGRPG